MFFTLMTLFTGSYFRFLRRGTFCPGKKFPKSRHRGGKGLAPASRPPSPMYPTRLAFLWLRYKVSGCILRFMDKCAKNRTPILPDKLEFDCSSYEPSGTQRCDDNRPAVHEMSAATRRKTGICRNISKRPVPENGTGRNLGISRLR